VFDKPSALMYLGISVARCKGRQAFV